MTKKLGPGICWDLVDVPMRSEARPTGRRVRALTILWQVGDYSPRSPAYDVAQPLEADLKEARTVYEAAGGQDGLLRLAQAWHARVLADEVVSHAFSHGFHPDHTGRLAAYWAEALGGPAAYSSRLGDETFVIRLHSGEGEHEEMDQRAIECFGRALEDVGLAEDETLGRVLHEYFAWATTNMAMYPESADDVPANLEIPLWSWDGPIEKPRP